VANLDTRAVLTNGFAQTVLHGTLVAHRGHVDKVDNDQATKVTQTQLTSNLIGRFQVGVERRFFNIAATGCACGVDVDCGQGFGGVDNDGTARRQAL
jgi:hypothetical protein